MPPACEINGYAAEQGNRIIEDYRATFWHGVVVILSFLIAVTEETDDMRSMPYNKSQSNYPKQPELTW